MPYITFEGGSLTRKQKSELIRRVTKAASEVMQVPMEFFLCSVKELPDENVGIGGRTIDLIKQDYLHDKKK